MRNSVFSISLPELYSDTVSRSFSHRLFVDPPWRDKHRCVVCARVLRRTVVAAETDQVGGCSATEARVDMIHRVRHRLLRQLSPIPSRDDPNIKLFLSYIAARNTTSPVFPLRFLPDPSFLLFSPPSHPALRCCGGFPARSRPLFASQTV